MLHSIAIGLKQPQGMFSVEILASNVGRHVESFASLKFWTPHLTQLLHLESVFVIPLALLSFDAVEGTQEEKKNL
jgi:hypothetical protein